MALFLTEAEIEERVDMPTVIEAVGRIETARGQGEAWLEPRRRLRAPKGMLHTMSAAWPAAGYFAHKAYAAFGGTIRFRVFLYEYASGEMVAVMEGNRLGQLRTGAATAVAAAHFWPEQEAPVVALFGTGLQAWGQLEALAAADRTLGEVRVYSRNADNRTQFARDAAEAFDLEVRPAEAPEVCVDGAGVVITATTSKDPVFPGAALAPGAFVAAVGANLRVKRELDGKALRAIDRIVVDDIPTAKNESGMLLMPTEAGFLQWQEIADLPELLSGAVPGRRSAGETLCFHSLGSATWDLASAIVAYDQARDAGVGEEIPLT